MKVILAEKELVAASIAKALQIPIKKGIGYYSLNDIYVTWSYGHLVSLDTHESYGYKDWNLENLPILPEAFNLRVINEGYIKKQFKIIRDLFLKANEIIVATDAGREGELIYRYIISLIGVNKVNADIKRLWISEFTPKSVVKGLKNSKHISNYDHIYHAAKARSEADWLIGINFTQCISLKANKGSMISIGRVQTTTLRMIVDRYIQNVKHEETFYYLPKIKVESGSEAFEMVSTTKFESENQAKTIKFDNANCTLNTSTKEIKEKPPLLFNLTQLQRIANRKYHFTADKTLDIAQSLYEKHKVLSYPRTESEYISANQKQDVIDTIQQIGKIFPCDFEKVVPQVLENVEGNSIFNDEKLTDHYAIIPTNNVIDINKLTPEENIIYRLVVQQFFRAFGNDCYKQKQTIKTQKSEVEFIKQITIVTNQGWTGIKFENEIQKPKLIDNSVNEENEIIESDDKAFLNIEDGELGILKGFKIEKKKTRPKPLFTDDTLLESMMNAGKFLEETDLKKAIKITGIGTSATRAETIKKLIKRNYIVRKKNKLFPTQLGVELIASLKDLSVADVKMTAIYEAKLSLIESGNLTHKEFISETKENIKETLPKIAKAGEILAKITLQEEKNKTLGKCPKCQSGDISLNKAAFYSCSNYNSELQCKFSIQGVVAKKKLNATHIKALLSEKKETSKIDGFKSKENKKFSGTLFLDTDLKVKFKPFQKNTNHKK